MSSHNFCTTAELAAELGKPDLGVIDGSWHLPNSGRLGAVEFPLGHIPGAVYFDIDAIADADSGLPHMLPKPDHLAAEMTKLGLGDGMRFVVYDVLGLFAAARVWWTLRAYGAHDVRILDGGLTKWIVEGRKLESGPAHPTPRTFTPRLDEFFVASLDEVRAALASGSAQVVDARPGERFRGEAPEPRAGLKSGHMPGSLNLPFSEVVEHGRLKPPDSSEDDLRGACGRPRQADHHDLRLRRQRGDPGAGGRGSRRQDRGPLRRLVGRMGRARRLPGGDRPCLTSSGRGVRGRTGRKRHSPLREALANTLAVKAELEGGIMGEADLARPHEDDRSPPYARAFPHLLCRPSSIGQKVSTLPAAPPQPEIAHLHGEPAQTMRRASST